MNSPLVPMPAVSMIWLQVCELLHSAGLAKVCACPASTRGVFLSVMVCERRHLNADDALALVPAGTMIWLRVCDLLHYCCMVGEALLGWQ